MCDDDDEEMVSILNVTDENTSYTSSSESDYGKSDANTNENNSGSSDCGSKTRVIHVSSNWLQVIDSGPGPSTPISVQNFECKATQHLLLNGQLSLFNIFIDMDLLNLILQETAMNENKKKMRSMSHLQKELESQTSCLEL